MPAAEVQRAHITTGRERVLRAQAHGPRIHIHGGGSREGRGVGRQIKDAVASLCDGPGNCAIVKGTQREHRHPQRGGHTSRGVANIERRVPRQCGRAERNLGIATISKLAGLHLERLRSDGEGAEGVVHTRAAGETVGGDGGIGRDGRVAAEVQAGVVGQLQFTTVE